MNIYDIIFKPKNSLYTKAVDSINRVSDIINGVITEEKKVSSRELDIVKNRWIKMSSEYGVGIHIMGLHIGEDYRSMLMHFCEKSVQYSHFHSLDFEIMYILDGECIDNETGTKLSKGDVYVVPKGAVHEIITKDKECYVYMMHSSDKHHLKVSESDKQMARAIAMDMIDNKHSFKAN